MKGENEGGNGLRIREEREERVCNLLRKVFNKFLKIPMKEV